MLARKPNVVIVVFQPKIKFSQSLFDSLSQSIADFVSLSVAIQVVLKKHFAFLSHVPLVLALALWQLIIVLVTKHTLNHELDFQYKKQNAGIADAFAFVRHRIF